MFNIFKKIKQKSKRTLIQFGIVLILLASFIFFYPIVYPNLKNIQQFSKLTTKFSANDYSNSRIEVLFTPGQPCTQRIIDHINQAQSEILVQAYSFTSSPIINALINAKKRGIKVIIILDKSQENSIYSIKIKNAGIDVYIDKLSGIAHNKVIIIDDQKIFTGSFNFSNAAQTKNAENSILIHDPKIVKQYKINFEARLAASYKFVIDELSKKVNSLIKKPKKLKSKL